MCALDRQIFCTVLCVPLATTLSCGFGHEYLEARDKQRLAAWYQCTWPPLFLVVTATS